MILYTEKTNNPKKVYINESKIFDLTKIIKYPFKSN